MYRPYKYDPYEFARQLCPPVLRSAVMTSLLRALLAPVASAARAFFDFRQGVRRDVLTTANVIVLEERLNSTFFLTNREIYITAPDDFRITMHREAESIPLHMHKESEGVKQYWLNYGEAPHRPNIIVNVPHFLEEDLQTIRDIMERYKPAGKTCDYAIYEYE